MGLKVLMNQESSLMQDRTFSSLKVEESPFTYYSKPIRIHCPYCKLDTSRTRTFHSLKSLDHHIAINHKTETLHPLPINETKEILKNLANAMKWGILP